MCVIVFAVSKWFDSSLSEVLILVLHHNSLVLVSLLENEPSEPVEEVLRHRFCNRYPQTETIGLDLEHQVFHPVP